jgi:hypothetical protein
MISSELEEVIEGSTASSCCATAATSPNSHAEATEHAVMTAMAHGDSDLVAEERAMSQAQIANRRRQTRRPAARRRRGRYDAGR